MEHNGVRFTGVYSVCQGQESTTPLEMSKERQNTDMCVHSWGTELISDVFGPNVRGAERPKRSRFFHHSDCKQLQLGRRRDSTFLI